MTQPQPVLKNYPDMTGITRQGSDTIEGIWRLFNRLPKSPARLERAYVATLRLMARRHDSILPLREAYTTTVDYYEAAMPLFLARARFRAHFLPHRSFLTLNRVCDRIVPEKLF
jgi:hypothetical protein